MGTIKLLKISKNQKQRVCDFCRNDQEFSAYHCEDINCEDAEKEFNKNMKNKIKNIEWVKESILNGLWVSPTHEICDTFISNRLFKLILNSNKLNLLPGHGVGECEYLTCQ